MDDLSPRLRDLGAAVAEASDRASDKAAIERARRRWVAPAPARSPAARRLILAAAAALCLAGGGAAWKLSAPSAVSFDVIASTGAPSRGAVGDWVAAGEGAPLDVRFSEGSSLRLAPGARMRVTRTHARGAEVLIERGSVHAAVVHTGSDTRWALRAGPFEVRVTGTAFDASWDPAADTFDLRMTEGSVLVSGPSVPPGRVVVAGEHLVISLRDGRMELTNARAAPATDTPPPSATPAAPPAPSPAACAAAAPSASSAPVAAASHRPADPGWKDLAAAGKYREALDAAERAGFAAEIGRASAADLYALADAARFAGRPARAREALLAARTRLGERGRSAFLLGKIAVDQQGSTGEAVRWFETYLREEPSGALAEQALGRILELKKGGDPAAAREAAERYLARYPNGAYAALARSLASP